MLIALAALYLNAICSAQNNLKYVRFNEVSFCFSVTQAHLLSGTKKDPAAVPGPYGRKNEKRNC